MNIKNVKNIVSKVSFFTLCSISLPFLVHNSSFQAPRLESTVREMRGETGYSELDEVVERVMKQSISAASLPFTIGSQTPLTKEIESYFRSHDKGAAVFDQKGWKEKKLVFHEGLPKLWNPRLSQVFAVVQPFLNSR